MIDRPSLENADFSLVDTKSRFLSLGWIDSVGYSRLETFSYHDMKEHTGIGPAISGGDFPQHQCAGQSPAAPLIPTGDDATPPPSVAVTANKPLTSRKDENKQQQAVATSSGPAEFDLQGLIDSEIEEVRSYLENTQRDNDAMQDYAVFSR